MKKIVLCLSILWSIAASTLPVYANYYAERARQQMSAQTDASGLEQTLLPLLSGEQYAWTTEIKRGTFRLDMDSINHPLHCGYTKTSWLPAEDLVAFGISDDWFNSISYNGHDLCGQCIQVTNLENGKFVNGIVTDRGHKYGTGGYVRADTVDLSLAAFEYLKGDFNDNLYQLEVKPVVCGTRVEHVHYYVEPTSTIAYYFSLLVENLPLAITRVEALDTTGQWVDLYRDTYNRWQSPTFTFKAEQKHINVRLHGIDGSVFEDSFEYLATGDRYPGTSAIADWAIKGQQEQEQPREIIAYETIQRIEPQDLVDSKEWLLQKNGETFVQFTGDGRIGITVNAPEDGNYQVLIRFKTPLGRKEQKLLINERIEKRLTFPSSNQWQLKKVNVILNAGENRLEIFADWGWMMFDEILVNAPVYE